jgi:hypothetical protein
MLEAVVFWREQKIPKLTTIQLCGGHEGRLLHLREPAEPGSASATYCRSTAASTFGLAARPG